MLPLTHTHTHYWHSVSVSSLNSHSCTPHLALCPMLPTYKVEIAEFTIEKRLQGWCSNVEIWSSECLVNLRHHVGQSTKNPLVQFTKVSLGASEVRIQSSRNILNTHSYVLGGLPYLVTEQPVSMALLYVKADEVTWNDKQQGTKDILTESMQSMPSVHTTGNITLIVRTFSVVWTCSTSSSLKTWFLWRHLRWEHIC